MTSTRTSPAGRLLRRATALAVPVVLSATGLAVVGPGVLPAVAADPPRPRIKVTQAVDPTTYAKAGQVLTWTSVVTNFGNTTLRELEVTDSVGALSDRSCTPVKIGGTLPAGTTTTCTATVTVTQADLDGDHATTDTVTASATTADQAAAVKASASATASATGTGTPGLTLTATTSPTSVARPGQKVDYTFVARNRGNQTLHGVLVTAPFPGLSALVCSPVPQGGSLAPGTTTTCRASRTITVAELAADPLKETAKVEATTTTGTRVANSGTASVAVKALPPAVPDETVGAVAGGPLVPLRGARNARPGEAGGPAIDLSRTVFVDADPGPPFDGKQKSSGNADWAIFPDGSVQVRQNLDESQSGNASVDYRVYDEAGHSTVGHLTVQIHQGATPGPAVAVTLKQNQPITVDVLSRDHPGQNADGTPSSFDRTSLRLTGVDLTEDDWDLPTNYGGDEQSISMVGVGGYTATADGRITFTPVAGYWGTPPAVRYSATSRGGSTESNVLVPTVQRVKPTAGAQATTVAYGRTAVLAVAAEAKAGHPSAPIVTSSVVLTSATATEGGKTLVTYRGTWRVQDDGSVRFSPADGFVGRTAPVEYSVADRNGTLATSTLTVTVRPGPKAVPDRGVTPKGSSVSLTPLGNDVPGVEADGSAGAFVTATLAFPTAGQPVGAAVTNAGHTLTVPAEGVWTAGSGVVTFAPVAGFAGGATPVSYTASDDLGKVETGRITVAVTSSTPAATDDEAATTFATSVKLPAATDDSPGSSSLVPASTVFPTVGQPPSATVSSGGKKVTVPGQGIWAMAADGSVTFVPDPAFAGTTAPVTYRVVDGSGQTATAALVVTVRPGPAGTPDVVSVHDDRVVVPLDQNDVPGRNADGTVGTIDPSTVRFAPTGQPAGWVISEEGHLATLPPVGGLQRSVFIDGNQVVTAYAPADFSGVFGPLVYTAQDRVVDAAGVARRHPFTSTMQVTFAASGEVGPTATDDHAVTTDQLPVRLAARTNDLGGRAGLQLEGTTFPADQLDRLPAGSTIADDQVVVAGEGTYTIDGRDVSVVFFPDAGFASDQPRDTTPVEYQIKDFQGRTARARLTVRVLPGAVARPDTVTTRQNVAVNVDVVANDDPGPSLTRVRIPRSLYGGQSFAAGQPKGSTYSSRTGQLTVPGQGAYSINRDGTVAFDPDSQFRGVASPVVIGESFEADRPFLGPFLVETTSTLQVTVVGADPPVARPDTASARVGQPLVVKALANDVAAPAAPLVGSSVRLRLTPGLPTGSTLSGDAKRLTVAGRGVFLAAGNGEITFVPLGTRTGVVPTIGYQVADTNGTTTRSTLTATVS
jgi:uncharacterized repeat protein (TIGR01451 family)